MSNLARTQPRRLIWTKKLTHESPLNTLFMEMTTPVITKLDPNYTKHQTAKWWDPEVTGLPHSL